MNIEMTIFGIIMSAMIIDSILFVFFGQKAVRKLRKNPATKDALGIEFMSGWDIVNVTIAFGFPRKLNRFLRRSGFAALHADADLLEKHMTRFDFILAKIHFSLWMAWVFALFIYFILDEIGIFK